MDQYLIDAFTDEVFQGNQAAVCVTETALSDDLMQNIASENNLSETAFLAPKNASDKEARFGLRWFTPGGEIDLCGHATLAAAFAVNRFVAPGTARIVFETRSGELPVRIQDELIVMDMPAYELKPVAVTESMARACGVRPLEAWLARDLICVLPSEESVQRAKPDPETLMELDGLLQVLTAAADPRSGYDCISRCFAPKLNVYEDPVTGSSHCALAPLWAEKLGKTKVRAFQASKRTGILECEIVGERIKLSGPAVLYARAELAL